MIYWPSSNYLGKNSYPKFPGPGKVIALPLVRAIIHKWMNLKTNYLPNLSQLGWMFVIQQQERNWTKMVFMGEPQGKNNNKKLLTKVQRIPNWISWRQMLMLYNLSTVRLCSRTIIRNTLTNLFYAQKKENDDFEVKFWT